MVPPLVGVAVKVTPTPSHAGLDPVVIATETETVDPDGTICTFTGDDVALVVPHVVVTV